MKNLIFVKHDINSPARFLFEVPADIEIHKGYFVMCDTKYGKAFGIADSEPFGGTNNELCAAELGVYMPLREVKQVCSPGFYALIKDRCKRQKTLKKLHRKEAADDINSAAFTNIDESELPF